MPERAKLGEDNFWLHKFRATFATRRLRAVSISARCSSGWAILQSAQRAKGPRITHGGFHDAHALRVAMLGGALPPVTQSRRDLSRLDHWGLRWLNSCSVKTGLVVPGKRSSGKPTSRKRNHQLRINLSLGGVGFGEGNCVPETSVDWRPTPMDFTIHGYPRTSRPVEKTSPKCFPGLLTRFHKPEAAQDRHRQPLQAHVCPSE